MCMSCDVIKNTGVCVGQRLYASICVCPCFQTSVFCAYSYFFVSGLYSIMTFNATDRSNEGMCTRTLSHTHTHTHSHTLSHSHSHSLSHTHSHTHTHSLS